jgi:hypothetical protein
LFPPFPAVLLLLLPWQISALSPLQPSSVDLTFIKQKYSNENRWDALSEVEKLIRHASSAVQFDDDRTAMDKLRSAVVILSALSSKP